MLHIEFAISQELPSDKRSRSGATSLPLSTRKRVKIFLDTRATEEGPGEKFVGLPYQLTTLYGHLKPERPVGWPRHDRPIEICE